MSIPSKRTVCLVEDERTNPSAQCDGDPGCQGRVVVMFFGSGDRMCAHCASDKLHSEIAEPAFRDTEKPAPMPEAEPSRP